MTITIDYSLKELRAKYRQFHGTKKGEKILKADIAIWLGALAEADIQDLDGYDEAGAGNKFFSHNGLQIGVVASQMFN